MRARPAPSTCRPESQAALAAGEAVGYVGYPMENLAVAGDNLQRPTPQMQFGRLTAITTDFNPSEDEARPGRLNTLLQHSLPATGGASGSPMLNERGEVIGMLSAVNFAMLGNRRIPTVVNFAQRANLVSELIDDDDASHAAIVLERRDPAAVHLGQGRGEGCRSRHPHLRLGIPDRRRTRRRQFRGVQGHRHRFLRHEVAACQYAVLASGDDLGVEMYARELELKLATQALPARRRIRRSQAQLEDSGVVIESIEIRPGLKAISFTADSPATCGVASS